MSKRCMGCMELFGNEFEICPHCGYIVGTEAEEKIHMDPGTILHDRYIIGRVLGFGGFGVTYIGWDAKLEQKVAIKEYLPGEFSTRMPGQSRVTIFNGDKNQQFHDGLVKFVEEAKRLAKFKNEPGIVRIFDSFEENDTAYIIMEYLDGETLTEYLREHGTIPEDQAVKMLLPVMESLKTVHAEGLLHRDIAPDNIFLTRTGEVKLIDFGASRYATTSHSRSLTVIIKPGFSPEEQYRSRGDQGPYTDVYALAATMYKMITGKTPPDAMERRAKYENQNKDILEEPHKLVRNISINRENAILNALNVRIEDRTPDVETFINELNADPPAKRRYGKIKKIDVYAWPVWIKVLIPTCLVAVLTFGVLLLTGVIDFSRYSTQIVIPDNIVIAPDVEGLQKDDAIDSIETNSLFARIGGSVESEYIAAGKIIMQTPVGGAFLEKNGTVELTISSGGAIVEAVDGIATVPFLIGDTKESALAKLKEAGLGEPVIEEVNDENVNAGLIISSSVGGGEQVEEGYVITLKVSLGPASFMIPGVEGKDVVSAKNMLESKGLNVSVTYEKSDTVPEGYVISQSLPENSEAKRGDSIILIVSSGEELVEVIDIVGKTRKEAEEELKKLGFAVYVRENNDNNVPAGSVISQSPAAGSSQQKGSTITIFVSKGKAVITVSYDTSGGSKIKDGTCYWNEPYGSLPKTEKDGYNFEGWFDAKEGGNKIGPDTLVGQTTKHTLFAHWTANTYNISFNAGDGKLKKEDSTKSVKYDSAYGNLPTPTLDGYGFEGWFTSETGGDEVKPSTIVKLQKDQVLYAHWSAGKITVSLDAQGGKLDTSSISVVVGKTYSGLPKTSKDGYDFDGWYDAESDGSRVDESTVVKASSSPKLYAHWTARTYTITFDSQGGDLNKDDSHKTVTYNSSYGSLPKTTKNGSEFEGWFTSKTGGTKVEPSSSVEITSDQVLYAHWKGNLVTVTLDYNNGQQKSETISVTFGGRYGALPKPNMKGYTFDNWYTDNKGGTAVTENTEVKNKDAHKLYARWIPEEYTVTLDPKGGKGSPSSISVTYGQQYTGLKDPTLDGYVFDGWYTEDNGGELISPNDTVSITDNRTLYAHWTKNDTATSEPGTPETPTPSEIVVTLDSNGGPGSSDTIYVQYGSTYTGLYDPETWSGHTFIGWFSDKEGGTQVTSNTRVASFSNHTLFAHWTVNTHTISFDSNGGSAVSSKTVSFGEQYGNLTDSSMTGYTFEGWFDSVNGGNKVGPTTVMGDSDVTLHAHWTVNTHTISFDSNGGSAVSSKTVSFGEQYGSLTDSSMTGYTFEGWFDSVNGGNKVGPTTVMGDSDVTLHAHWIANTHTISFDSNGGSAVSSKTVLFGEQYGSLTDSSMTGYTFEGWFDSVNGGNIVGPTTVMGDSDVTLHAHWTRNTYTLSFNACGGSASENTRQVLFDSEYGGLPNATKDYNNFLGWFTQENGGTQVSGTTHMTSNNVTVYAHWELKPVSGWILAGNVPSGAQIVERKWTYTRTQTIETRNGLLGVGWEEIGSYEQTTGSGSQYFASFPSTFDTSNSIYTSFAKEQPYTSHVEVVNTNTEAYYIGRHVSVSHAGYVYWHWMYDVAYSTSFKRTIADKKGIGTSNYNFKYFWALASSTDCPTASDNHSYVSGYNPGKAPDTYDCRSIITSGNQPHGTPRMLRFEYYLCSYTDYERIHQYRKVTQEESSTQVYNGGEISDVQEYVKYRAK